MKAQMGIKRRSDSTSSVLMCRSGCHLESTFRVLRVAAWGLVRRRTLLYSEKEMVVI